MTFTSYSDQRQTWPFTFPESEIWMGV